MPEEPVIKGIESLPRPENLNPVEGEASLEQAAEKAPEQRAESKIENTQPAPTPSTAQTAPVSTFKTPQQIRSEQIDQILSEGLEEVFLSLPPKQQKQFQVEGEKTVRKINDLLNTTKAKIKTIIDLIKKWLSIIPSVNKFFLEQEAKIKADKIIKLKG